MEFLQTVLITFVLILVVIAAMSVGVLAGRPPIRGSCGGVGNGPFELCSGGCRQRNAREEDG